jgi:hypothetical protein
MDWLTRRIVKLLKPRELLKIGNRSYVNAFKYPESYFDVKDLLDGGQVDDPSICLRDPGKLFTDFAIIPPDQLVFKLGDKYYSKSGLPETAGMISGGLTDAAAVIQAAINALTSGRTWKETIVLKGELPIKTGLTVPDYTILKHGKLKAAANNITILTLGSHVDIINVHVFGDYTVTAGVNGVNIPAGKGDIRIKHCRIDDLDGYGVNLAGASGSPVAQVKIIDNVVEDCGSHCITGSYVTDSRIQDNLLGGANVNSHGIFLQNSGALLIRGNQIYAGGVGVSLAKATSRIIIAKNLITNLDKHGIYLEGSSANSDIQAIIKGNVIDNCGLGGGDLYGGVFLKDGNYIKVIGNRIRGSLLRHAVWEYSGTDHNLIAFNDVASHLTPISLTGANSVAVFNKGYNPQAASTPTVPASPATFGPYNYPVMIIVYGGTVSDISIRGLSTGLTSGTFYLHPGDTLTITYTATPTVKIYPM